MLESKTENQNMRMNPPVRDQNEQVRIRRNRLFSYKSALWLHDVFILGSLAFLCCLPALNGNHLLLNVLLATAGLFLFHNARLYSYHLIFSLRGHLMAIGQALLNLLLTLGVMVTITSIPKDTVADTYFVPLTLMGAVAIVALNRKFQLNLINLLYPVGFSFVVMGIYETLRHNDPIDSGYYWAPAVGMLLAASVLLTASRLFVVHILFNHLLRRKFRRQVLVVGSNTEANEFTRHICDLNAPFWIAGAVDYREDQKCELDSVPNKACLGNLHDIPELTLQHNISEIVVTAQHITKNDLITLLDFCTSTGINAWFSPQLMPIIDIKLYIDRFCGQPMIRLCSQKYSWLFFKLKHTIDALITLPAFILQIPLFLLLVASVKLDSKGPAFYKARAIGKNGQPFDMYKFRSMYVDSEKAIHQQYVTKLIKGEIDTKEKDSGPLKIVDDPRVTRVGKFLRKISLDELPQLINVLKGQMSLVGPRPCLPYEYDIYQDWHKKRTVIRPGITGLWQVTGRSEVLFEDMILLDLYYIYNSSLVLDLQILVETVFVVLGKKGAF